MMRYGPDIDLSDDRKVNRLLQAVESVCCPSCGCDDGSAPSTCEYPGCGATTCDHCTYHRHGMLLCATHYRHLRRVSRGQIQPGVYSFLHAYMQRERRKQVKARCGVTG